MQRRVGPRDLFGRDRSGRSFAGCVVPGCHRRSRIDDISRAFYRSPDRRRVCFRRIGIIAPGFYRTFVLSVKRKAKAAAWPPQSKSAVGPPHSIWTAPPIRLSTSVAGQWRRFGLSFHRQTCFAVCHPRAKAPPLLRHLLIDQ